MPVTEQQGTVGALNLASFVVLIVGGALATVTGLGLLDSDRFMVRGIILIGLAALTFFAAYVAWREDAQLAGFLGIAAAVGLLLLRAETEGILVLLAGVISLVGTRLDAKET